MCNSEATATKLARELASNGKFTMWCAPLVEAIEARTPGGALHFAKELLKLVIKECPQTQYAEWLTEFEWTLLTPKSPLQLGQRAREIWYFGKRTPLQTAISKVFESLAAYRAGNLVGYERGLGITLSLLMSENGAKLDKSVIETTLCLFHTYFPRERGKGSEPHGPNTG